MSDYSKSPLDLLVANQQKGYIGLHIEQGVPLLDRDLNLLHDLISATVRSVIARYIGNGIPAGGDGFAIQALTSPQNSQDFRIAASATGAGSCLVGGIEVSIPADMTYKSQPGAPPLTTPTTAQPDPRIDTVFLDVFINEIDGTADPDLSNSIDVGMETSVRLMPAFVVRVAEGVAVPAAPAGHFFYTLAQLARPRGKDTIDATTITDLRQSRLTMSDMEKRVSLIERLLVLPSFINPPLQFMPKSGPIGQTILLNGNNFNVGPLQVRFGNVPAVIAGAPSATQVAVKVPGGLTPTAVPTAVKITITNGGGSDTSDDMFTALPAPAFTDPATQFSPNHGTPGQQVTINGFNFNASSVSVLFGTVAASIVGTPTANQIVVQTPAGLVPTGSTSADVKITINTPLGSVQSDDTFHAEINIPAPTFAAPPTAQFLPKTGAGGQNVTLVGTNFNFGPVSVRFDTVQLATAQVIGTPSPTQIAVQVPANMIAAGSQPKGVKILVTTAGGTVVSTDTFTVTGP